MSGDREARLLGAGETIKIGEKEYRLRPVVAQHLVDLEREALDFYRRQYLRAFSQSAELLGDQATEIVREEVAKVAHWGLDDLPRKKAYDVSKVPVTDEAKIWVKENLQVEDFGDNPDERIRRLLATALDQERISPEEIKGMTGKIPLQGLVRYDQWWVTACMAGMVSFITSSVKYEHSEVTKEMVGQWTFDQIAEASRKVEGITSPDMGNT